MRRPHKVPLSEQVLALIAELKPMTGEGQYLFPSIRAMTRPITDNTLNAALRRLGYDKSEVTAHGFRATASTLLNEMGKWHPDAIERSEEHTSELQSLMRISYAVFCLKKQTYTTEPAYNNPKYTHILKHHTKPTKSHFLTTP